MDKTYKIRKVGGDKIALLGLFIVSLLIARIIVVSKSAILLSEPIKLTQTGLSVSMPEGNGWKSDKQWRDYENGFSLRSRFALGTRNPTAEARCVYILATGTTDPQSLFEQKAFDAEGEIVKVDQITKGTLTFDWVHIENPKTSHIFIFGTAKLPNNRRLDIEVHQIMNDPYMAEQAFKKIVNSLNFEENQLVNINRHSSYHASQKQRHQRFFRQPKANLLKISTTGRYIYSRKPTADDIINKFPERAEYILRTNKMLQYNKSDYNKETV